MRYLLRPGTHVLRRGPGELQVGLEPPRAVVLRDTEAVRSTLDLLRTSCAAPERLDPGTLRLLLAHDLLVDESWVLPLVPVAPAADDNDGTGDPDGALTRRHDAAALARRRGPDAPRLLRERRAATAEVAGFGGPLDLWLVDTATTLLTAVGMRVRRTSGRRRTTRPADVGLLVGVGEPDRALADHWTRTSTPHLVLRLREGAALLGPLVVPGRTACLHCLDAHATDADPAWPLLVTQYASCTRVERDDGVPEPVDLPLASLALAWAVRDLVAHLEGSRPSTYSSTVHLDAELSRIETRPWLRHPDCGCAWNEVASTSA